jgi:hypothetical protein
MKKDTIILNGWRDLEQFGINSLTGEADRLSMRLLCDVNEEGRALVLDYLGLPAETVLHDNHNSQVNDSPAIGSLMLARDSFSQLATFTLFRAGALAIIHMGTQQMGVFTQERLTQYEELARESLADSRPMRVDIHRNPMIGNTAPGSGTRNMHMMTGRIV